MGFFHITHVDQHLKLWHGKDFNFNFNALKYLTSFYVTKSAPMYVACFKDSIRTRTDGKQASSCLSDRPVYLTSWLLET